MPIHANGSPIAMLVPVSFLVLKQQHKWGKTHTCKLHHSSLGQKKYFWNILLFKKCANSSAWFSARLDLYLPLIVFSLGHHCFQSYSTPSTTKYPVLVMFITFCASLVFSGNSFLLIISYILCFLLSKQVHVKQHLQPHYSFLHYSFLVCTWHKLINCAVLTYHLVNNPLDWPFSKEK